MPVDGLLILIVVYRFLYEGRQVPVDVEQRVFVFYLADFQRFPILVVNQNHLKILFEIQISRPNCRYPEPEFVKCALESTFE